MKTFPKSSQAGSASTGKSKVISTSTPAGVRGGKTKMFGKQSSAPAKAR